MPRYAKKTTRKRTYRKKAAPKKRTYRRKTSSSLAKKIHAVADTKKCDQMACAIASTTNPTGATPVEFMDFPFDGATKIYAWAPLSRTGADKKGNHLRNQTSIHVTGFSEKMNIAAASRVPFRHRRIIIRGQINAQARAMKSKLDPTLIYRNLDQVPPDYMDIYFAGTKGTDWSDPMKATIDRNLVTVLYDKVKTYNPPNEFGLDRFINYYHKINRRVTYLDDENGSSTQWSDILSGKHGDDIIVCDMFRSSVDTRNDDRFPFGEERATVGTLAKLYWRET